MIINKTPFRISFFGGGTDYPVWFKKNKGAVISTTIDKYCYLTCRKLPPFFDHKHHIVYSKDEKVNNADEIQHPAVREIFKYMSVNEGLEIHYDADLPARSGLGSSSSFTVGLLHTLYALNGVNKTEKQLAEEAIEVEQNIIKENVGSQDQIAAAYGGLNKIDFYHDGTFNVTNIKISKDRLNDLQSHILFFFTGISRIASSIAGEQIKKTNSIKSELTSIYNMVDEGFEILTNENTPITQFGKLLHESWLIKRGLTNKISNNQIDAMYAAALEAGGIGGKITGAGGGGFMMVFAEPAYHDKIKEKLKNYLFVPISFTKNGSKIIFHSI
tara:strand:+ start:101 stop:1087 length:987 start_codon:yes stop_codon:yes gene_type:complete